MLTGRRNVMKKQPSAAPSIARDQGTDQTPCKPPLAREPPDIRQLQARVEGEHREGVDEVKKEERHREKSGEQLPHPREHSLCECQNPERADHGKIRQQ